MAMAVSRTDAGRPTFRPNTRQCEIEGLGPAPRHGVLSALRGSPDPAAVLQSLLSRGTASSERSRSFVRFLRGQSRSLGGSSHRVCVSPWGKAFDRTQWLTTPLSVPAVDAKDRFGPVCVDRGGHNRRQRSHPRRAPRQPRGSLAVKMGSDVNILLLPGDEWSALGRTRQR